MAKDLDIDPGELSLPPRLMAEPSGGWDDDPVAAYLRMLDVGGSGRRRWRGRCR